MPGVASRSPTRGGPHVDRHRGGIELTPLTVDEVPMEKFISIRAFRKMLLGRLSSSPSNSTVFCGACTVLVGRIVGGRLSYETVNACIRFVGSLNATHVVTVEHLAAKDGTLHRNFKRMLNAGGFAAHYMSNVDGARDRFPDYLDAVAQTPYLLAMGIGTDTSGLAGQPGPRSNPGDPLVYPFTTEFGTVFDRQKSGNRTFDLNNEGMAHYGLLPDLIEDIRQRTDSRIYEGIMNSAEGYLQMWERAESNNDAQYVSPL